MSPRPEFQQAVWRTGSRSNGNGDCIEVTQTATLVGVRDSKDPTGPVLAVGPQEWTAFLTSIRHGHFD